VQLTVGLELESHPATSATHLVVLDLDVGHLGHDEGAERKVAPASPPRRPDRVTAGGSRSYHPDEDREGDLGLSLTGIP
jgi:hypothetical protein